MYVTKNYRKVQKENINIEQIYIFSKVVAVNYFRIWDNTDTLSILRG